MCQAIAQPGEVARPRAAQGDARRDALDVGDGLEPLAHRLPGAVTGLAEQLRDGGVPLRRLVAIGQRMMQAMTQPAGAHAGRAGVEQRQQRRRRLAAQRFGNFQIAPRGGVEAKVSPFVLDGQAGDVRQRLHLRRARVGVERAGGADGERREIGAEAGQVAGAEVLGQLPGGGPAVELPVRQALDAGGARGLHVVRQRFGDQHLGRPQALDLRRQRRQRCFEQAEVAAGQVEPGQADAVAFAGDGSDQVVAPCLEQRLVGERAGRDDAHHLALDRALAGGRIADLLADGHRLA